MATRTSRSTAARARRVEIRQTKADRYLPDLYVVPVNAAAKAEVLAAVQAKIKSVPATYPGVAVEDRGTEIKVTVPDALRVGHEAHFAQVASSFLKYVRNRSALPAWERPNMLAKYYTTTAGAELSRQSPPKPADRIAPR